MNFIPAATRMAPGLGFPTYPTNPPIVKGSFQPPQAYTPSFVSTGFQNTGSVTASFDSFGMGGNMPPGSGMPGVGAQMQDPMQMVMMILTMMMSMLQMLAGNMQGAELELPETNLPGSDDFLPEEIEETPPENIQEILPDKTKTNPKEKLKPEPEPEPEAEPAPKPPPEDPPQKDPPAADTTGGGDDSGY